jgi:hypothetical protein
LIPGNIDDGFRHRDDESVPGIRVTRVRLGGELRLLMIAAPGSSKGTRGKRLAAKFSMQHFSSGRYCVAGYRAAAIDRRRGSTGQNFRSATSKHPRRAANLMTKSRIQARMKAPACSAAE